MKTGLQRYAVKIDNAWTVFEAPCPARLGEGRIVVRGLTEEEMVRRLRLRGKRAEEVLGVLKKAPP